MNIWTGEQENIWTGEQENIWTYEQGNIWTGEHMNRRTGEQENIWTGEHMNRGTVEQENIWTYEQENIWTGEHMNRRTGEQWNRGTGEQENIWTGEQENIWTGEKGRRVLYHICRFLVSCGRNPASSDSSFYPEIGTFLRGQLAQFNTVPSICVSVQLVENSAFTLDMRWMDGVSGCPLQVYVCRGSVYPWCQGECVLLVSGWVCTLGVMGSVYSWLSMGSVYSWLSMGSVYSCCHGGVCTLVVMGEGTSIGHKNMP